ncbi:hypothetical protein GCM10009848_02320 [Micromonospora lupini]
MPWEGAASEGAGWAVGSDPGCRTGVGLSAYIGVFSMPLTLPAFRREGQARPSRENRAGRTVRP